MKQIFSIVLATIFMTSCGIYSFTGASIPTEAKTVSVAYFTTTATNSPSSLNQTLTEGLKDLFLSQTNLDLTELEGDLSFSGQITKYQLSPMAIQANETAGQNRLTIDIKVKYTNSDFSSSQNLADVEIVLIEEITKELLEDVFNKAFVNW